MKLRSALLVLLIIIVGAAIVVIGPLVGRGQEKARAVSTKAFSSDDIFDGKKIVRSEAEWQKLLSREAFYVLRKSGTERPYTGALTDNKEPGVYACGACGMHLFSSKHKYDSGTGWPSFFQVINRKNVDDKPDLSIASEPRTEVLCARCGSHLGHVFDDGPEPTGLRYCINSVSLKFLPKP